MNLHEILVEANRQRSNDGEKPVTCDSLVVIQDGDWHYQVLELHVEGDGTIVLHVPR